MPGLHKSFGSFAAAAVVLGAVVGCGGGGGSPAGNNVQHPLVRQFSPTMSPIDFNTGLANPTFTDGMLTVSTDPAYPGKIVVFFQSETKIDPKSVFIGGNPALGIDLSAFQVLQDIPGTGLVPLQAAQVDVFDDRIVFTPATLPLPDGQYSIGVFANLKSVEGDPVEKAPVFHSFTVGLVDNIRPVVVVTSPVDHQTGVGAGLPPPAPPSGVPSSSVADIRTAIFGPTSPDVYVRFSESVAASSVNASNVTVTIASQTLQAPLILPAPGFPKLRSQLDHSSLPSNGFELVWRADPLGGGLPFGAQIQVKISGEDGNPSSSPIRDRSGNAMLNSFIFQFQTVAPPDLPSNSEPQYSIYMSAQDRIGVIDTVNQPEVGNKWLISQGVVIPGWTGSTLVATNQFVAKSDQISDKQHLGAKFDPQEISLDQRTNGASGHTFAYVQSFQSGQIVVVNTRTSLPAALINTPSPGGLSNQTGGGQSPNVLLATNSSANTFTVFNMGSVTTGQQYIDAPITILQVTPTGNTPRAIAIEPGNTWDQVGPFGPAGTLPPMIMYADFSDGVVNTTLLNKSLPVRSFPLGTAASPNDVSFTGCFNPPGILYCAISEGGTPGNGKVSYYVSGPNCSTGVSTGGAPDSIVGDLSGFDAPAGLDCIKPASVPATFFALAESGSTANRVVTLQLAPGTGNLPGIVAAFDTGANPVAIAHVPAYFAPGICGVDICAWPPQPPPFCNCGGPVPSKQYGSTLQAAANVDGNGLSSIFLYVAVRGAGRVEVINMNDGAVPITPVRDPSSTSPSGKINPADRIPFPGIRGTYSMCSE
jgi:hypothetical protein